MLVGRRGATKERIERECSVRLEIDSRSGETVIRSDGAPDMMLPFKAAEIVRAIGRGFPPRKAMRLLRGENTLHVMDLREFAGKSPSQVERIKGRIIGEHGRARTNMEHLSGTDISVYGRTVAVIGDVEQLRLAVDAISSLCSGSMHGSVYGRLESARRRQKQERMRLWEQQDVF